MIQHIAPSAGDQVHVRHCAVLRENKQLWSFYKGEFAFDTLAYSSSLTKCSERTIPAIPGRSEGHWPGSGLRCTSETPHGNRSTGSRWACREMSRLGQQEVGLQLPQSLPPQIRFWELGGWGGEPVTRDQGPSRESGRGTRSEGARKGGTRDSFSDSRAGKGAVLEEHCRTP